LTEFLADKSKNESGGAQRKGFRKRAGSFIETSNPGMDSLRHKKYTFQRNVSVIASSTALVSFKSLSGLVSIELLYFVGDVYKNVKDFLLETLEIKCRAIDC
jgi:hypothetical protein